MKKIASAGRLSLEAGQILLDGSPISEGQVILSRYGKGEPLPGRIEYQPETGWCLSREEFIRHTYLDIPLDEDTFPDLVVIAVE